MGLHDTVLLTHSYLRWVVLLAGIVVIVLSVSAWIRNTPWTRYESKLSRFWISAFDLQVLLGLALYLFLSPSATAARRNPTMSMGDAILRFWLLEHAFGMLLANGILHLGNRWARRAGSDRARQRAVAISALAALSLAAASVPWPERRMGRPIARTTQQDFDFRRCLVPSAELQSGLPKRLSETGLYEDFGTRRIAAGVKPYRPRFELWSDGAAKQRWILLPEGKQIDTSDPDAWRFPVGTRLWKEFSVAGKRIETRLLAKLGPGADDWGQMSYAWEDDERDPVAVPEGRRDGRRTGHDIPSAAECSACHARAASRVLGFSAIQLDHRDDGQTLSGLTSEGRLSITTRPSRIPGSEKAVAAIGALHANCGHCHNSLQGRKNEAARCYDPKTPFQFFLSVHDLQSVEKVAAYRTSIGSLIDPAKPESSKLLSRMGHRRMLIPGMAPLASEQVDQAALQAVTAWIRELKPD